MWSNMPGEGIGWRSQRYGSPWSESPGDKVQTRGKEQNHRTIANFYYLNTNRRKGLKKDQKKKEKGTAVSQKKTRKGFCPSSHQGMQEFQEAKVGSDIYCFPYRHIHLWAVQTVSLHFAIRRYRKPRTNFMANPILAPGRLQAPMAGPGSYTMGILHSIQSRILLCFSLEKNEQQCQSNLSKVSIKPEEKSRKMGAERRLLN